MIIRDCLIPLFFIHFVVSKMYTHFVCILIPLFFQYNEQNDAKLHYISIVTDSFSYDLKKGYRYKMKHRGHASHYLCLHHYLYISFSLLFLFIINLLSLITLFHYLFHSFLPSLSYLLVLYLYRIFLSFSPPSSLFSPPSIHSNTSTKQVGVGGS